MMMMTTITTLLQARSHIFLFFLYFYTNPSNYTLLNTSFLPRFFFLARLLSNLFSLSFYFSSCVRCGMSSCLTYLLKYISLQKKIYRHRRHQDNTLVLIYFILEATSTFSCTHDHQKGSMDTFPCHHHHRKNRKRKVKVGSNRASCVTSYHFSHAQKICVNMHIGK